MGLFSFLRKSQPEVQQSALSVERVIGYLFSCFVSQEPVREPLHRFLELQAGANTVDRLLEYLNLYTTVERTLLNQQPPVVEYVYTREEVRREIISRFSADTLPPTFAVIFMSPKAQYRYLGSLIIGSFSAYLARAFGAAKLRLLIDSLPLNHAMRSLQVDEAGQLDWTVAAKFLDQLGEEQVVSSLSTTISLFHAEIVTHFGQKTADDLVLKLYQPIKHSYDFDVVNRTLALLPVTVLEDERLTFLSRDELERRLTDARNAERSREEFFSIASHELRTPLTAIRGYSELLEQMYIPTVNDPQFTKFVGAIHDSSKRLIEIVNDFLNMSSLEQGKISFVNKPLVLTNLLNDVSDDVASVASQRGITLTRDYIDEPFEVTADANRLKQVLINLLGNAIKFSDQGAVSIGVRHLPSEIEVTVTDTGKGVSEENQHLLFRKFQQAGDSILTRDASSGTGLGLYISKLIMEGLHGHIYLKESVVGEGSTFAISLPRTK
jgi:signal transduction histidine kinase